ncbi:50S ribosomal protein L32 [bacterium]|nr:50S ribosomal protein L32 [bacterium]RKZ27144.1 MAG: 50S ribosomal protein L32 [bacterium]
MALPKRRHSNQRTRKRRTHYKLRTVKTVECPNCGEQMVPHRVCPGCGYYDGHPVISLKTKKEKEK